MENRYISFSPPDISETEISNVVKALRSGWITTGPRTKLLERRLVAYIESGRNDIDCTSMEALTDYSDRCVCLGSATAAEELNLRMFGVGIGDEVIVPAYTYSATASAAVHAGAMVRFCDIRMNEDTNVPEMDYDALEQMITEKTKAVIPVDIGGVLCDYDRIYEILDRKKNLFKVKDSDGTTLGELSNRIENAIGRVAVIADSAHALGASRTVGGKKLYSGVIADFTSFSFHAVKSFTTAEGGASIWKPIPGIDNAEIYKMYQLMSLHGQNKDALTKHMAGSWEYDIIAPWYKCNMTDVAAAMGLGQLDRFPGLLEHREEILKIYDKAMDEMGISHLIHHVPGMDSSKHLYMIRISGIDEETRNNVINHMASQGVAVNVHYKPLPMMTAYKEMSGGIERYPGAYDYYKNEITLPFHTLLSDEDVYYVCEVLKEAIKTVGV